MVHPVLKDEHPATFAGLYVDHAHRTMIIYRKPDPALDQRVRAMARDVRLVFMDARFSLREMKDLTRRVHADARSWNAEGIQITLAGPRFDGSGIRVGTALGLPQEGERLRRHYETDAIEIVVARPTYDAPPPAPGVIS